MCEPRVIDSCRLSQRIVKKILIEEDTIAVTIKQKHFQKPGEIYLIIIGTVSGDVFLFDLRRCPAILHEGALWRILKSPALLKVMHDCRVASDTLRTQYGVELNYVFDTQAAYSLLLMEKKMPARLIELHNMYEKFGDAGQKFMPMLQESVETGGIYWAQRPMSKDMMYTVGCEVLALLPTMYENIKRDISVDLMDLFEDLCRAYATGNFHRPSKHLKTMQCPSKSSRSARSLNQEDKTLLRDSLPKPASCYS